jgi:hypothetical protein
MVGTANAQSTVELSGLFYMDYEYILASPDTAREGDNGFRYRRLYLTADYDISEQFSGRARLEAQTSRLTQGRPFAFVKDLWLKWKGIFGGNHDAIFGVQSPPSFTISERWWGYRSLERTIMDRNSIVSSRDFGVQLKGAFSSSSDFGYAVMLGNNSSVIGETDKSKRVYGQLSWLHDDRIAATGGADYAAGPDRNTITTNAFVAYDAGVVRVGFEGYFRNIDLKSSESNIKVLGGSGWVVARAGEQIEIIGRVDRVERDIPEDLDVEVSGSDLNETFGILGLAFIPHRNVRFVPNVLFSQFTDRDARVVPRITLHADF